MREVTRLMIEEFKIDKLGYDFMGYEFKNENNLSFHHLIVPRRKCKAKRIENEGYVRWNGAILTQNTAHNYLHLIEQYDRDMFMYITSEMIDENIKGHLSMENIQNIHDVLNQFEKEYSGARGKNGAPLIKREYTKRLIKRR